MTASAELTERPRAGAKRARRNRRLHAVGSMGVTVALAAAVVFTTEMIVRGSLAQTLEFFRQPFRPSWTTVALFSLLLLGFDALFGRRHMGILLVGPLAVLLAAIGHQKSLYLGDPLYPTDFLYSRQIVELMPLLVRERPMTAIAMALAIMFVLAVLVFAWRWWRGRMSAMSMRGRLARLAVVAPALAFFASIMDYETFSWTRDRLKIFPVMWDQKENYNTNGFTLAFALNVPMAKVAAPPGFSEAAIDAISAPLGAATLPADKPDIIMVMSESFWDPTRLPGVSITPDPIPTVRANQSGWMFSPEFGGMTANVEFEALTGFSNAFLPYGSIPYQQYVRGEVPSLATFFASEGYETRAIHPFEGWFWNRAPVYKSFGFHDFKSVENLPKLEARGNLVSDAALTEEIIREADGTEEPFFFFAVSLQNHGPYEPGRYRNTTHRVRGGKTEWGSGSILTYADGIADADRSLQRLMDWAAARERPTVIAFFGDHLPPLGPVYQETGFLKEPVAPRKGSKWEMAKNRQTPLVIWSNRGGAVEQLGPVSPAFLPLHVLETAGISHPYYTGFLGTIRDRYAVIERSLLISPSGTARNDWLQAKELEPGLRDMRALQYDVLFGKKRGFAKFFPEMTRRRPAA